MHKFQDSGVPAADLIDVDFGETIGRKRSSAQIVHHYDATSLLGCMVACVVNVPPRRIGPMMSELLALGFPDWDGHIVLVGPDHDVPDGARLF